MNKILSRDWMKSFGHIEQHLVHSSDRYFEVTSEVSETHLASASSWTIGMPGLTLDNVIIRPENRLIIGDLTEKESIQSVYLISGHADSTFDFGNKQAIMKKSRHAFQYSSGYEAQHTIIAGHFHALSIDITPDFFKGLMTTTEGEVNDIYNSFIRGESLQSVLILQPRMHEVINYILQCPFKGVTRYLFIESKVLELLALQIDQINSVRMLKQPKSKSDIEKLVAVKEHIESNYLESLSLAGLCKTFSLNEFKLKKGYKELFNSTVFGHINSLRMEKAREFLIQGQMNISEIADFIGYKNIGSFSAEFKKRFGHVPSKFSR
jgi:AraC-like DNA-binding protein